VLLASHVVLGRSDAFGDEERLLSYDEQQRNRQFQGVNGSNEAKRDPETDESSQTIVE
jgi:hypothetical protein